MLGVSGCLGCRVWGLAPCRQWRVCNDAGLTGVLFGNSHTIACCCFMTPVTDAQSNPASLLDGALTGDKHACTQVWTGSLGEISTESAVSSSWPAEVVLLFVSLGFGAAW